MKLLNKAASKKATIAAGTLAAAVFASGAGLKLCWLPILPVLNGLGL